MDMNTGDSWSEDGENSECSSYISVVVVEESDESEVEVDMVNKIYKKTATHSIKVEI